MYVDVCVDSCMDGKYQSWETTYILIAVVTEYSNATFSFNKILVLALDLHFEYAHTPQEVELEWQEEELTE